jgi:hypothetical protein
LHPLRLGRGPVNDARANRLRRGEGAV